MRPRTASRLLALAVCAAAGAAPCAAQVEVGVDAAASWVHYQGFLGSSAASVAPSLIWRSPRTTLAARGSFLVFESGNTTVQGLLTASTFTAPVGPLRAELGAEAGAGEYVGFARFAHALGRVRAHVLGSHWGAWAGPLAGTVSTDGAGNGAAGLEAGGWTRWPLGALEVGWTRVTVRDTSFTDLVVRARAGPGVFDLSGSLGTRTSNRGGVPAGYGDLSVAMRLGGPLALIVSVGKYPSDPVGGSVAGRYVTVGVRLAPPPARRSPVASLAAGAYGRGSETPVGPEAAVVAIEPHGDLSVPVLRAAGARLVEVMGDFTDWQPVALTACPDGRWRYESGLPAGMYRFNVRLDRGPWSVPAGVPAADDEFGSSVGVLVVP